MLYCNMDLKPRIHYILEISKYQMILSGFRRNCSTSKCKTNNVYDDGTAFFNHVEDININYSVISSYKDEKTVHAVNNMHTAMQGMILVTLYAEQQVGAAMNLFLLQKWAKLVGASVVEPFVDNSMLKLPIVSSEKHLAAQLHYSDYFNIDIWNNMSIAMNGTPLIPWEKFIDQAPMKYIFVAIVNSLEKVERAIYIGDEIMKQEHCSKEFND